MKHIQPKLPLSEEEIKLTRPEELTPVQAENGIDRAETTALFHRHAPALFAYLRQHTGSREDAEDLLHEVFAAALQRSQFALLSDADQGQWLWRVARNKAIDTYRRKTRRPSLSLEYVVDELEAREEQSPEYALLRREEYANLLAALERLPTMQQEALRLRFVNNLPCAAIAQVLGKREGAVRSMLSRAMDRLRTIYTEKKEV